jgi:hypothetical protein
MLNIFFINTYNANTYGIQVNFSAPYVDVRDDRLILDETLSGYEI